MVMMAQPKSASLAEVQAAARRLFAGNGTLTIWDALERVLGELTTPELSLLYRRSRTDWCLAVIPQGHEPMVAAGVERLGVQIRNSDPALRCQDDYRSQASEGTRAGSRSRQAGRRR